MINSPRNIFDPQLKQHKFVEETREENKNPVSMKRNVPNLYQKKSVATKSTAL